MRTEIIQDFVLFSMITPGNEIIYETDSQHLFLAMEESNPDSLRVYLLKFDIRPFEAWFCTAWSSDIRSCILIGGQYHASRHS